MIYAVYDNGAAKVLKSNLNASQADKEIAVKIAVRNLTDAFIAQDAAENIIYEFVAALGWQVEKSVPPSLSAEKAVKKEKITYKNGSVYEGDIVNGKKHGKGARLCTASSGVDE